MLSLIILPSVKSSLSFLVALPLSRNKPNSAQLITKLEDPSDPSRLSSDTVCQGRLADSFCLLGWDEGTEVPLTVCSASRSQNTLFGTGLLFTLIAGVLVKAGQSLGEGAGSGEGSLPHLFLILRTHQMDLG